MRADRLLSLLLLLQSRGQLSAHDLAAELEVSVRTIYRDIDALCTSGIPIYAEQGREGGYRLMEHYRNALNGLTTDEISALLMFNIPDSLAVLDAGQTLKKALLKLIAASGQPAALPIYLDWENRESIPYLPLLYQAVRDGLTVRIRYRIANRIDIEREVEPYGLVANSGDWWLVYQGGGRIHTQRIVELLEVQEIGTRFTRPADFDLATFWKTQYRVSHSHYHGTVRMKTADLPYFTRFLKQHQAANRETEGEYTCLDLTFESIYAARSSLLSLGGAVEVLEPEPLRATLVDFAAQITRVYG